MYSAKQSTHSQVITLFEKFFPMIYWYITMLDPDLEIRPLDNGEAQSQNVLIRHSIKLNQML